jgi:hypothetical protein
VSALTVLALLGTAAPAPAAPTGSAARGAAKPKVSTDFTVYYRRADDSAWKFHASFTDLDRARSAAGGLYRDGHDVRIQQTMTLLRPRAPQPAPTSAVSKDVLTPEQAQAVFDVMASRSDIAFRYPTDGCYARAHLMVRHMVSLGYKPAKVWAFSRSKKEPLYARTANHPRGYVTWRWHVAPILRVREAGGKPRWYVIDPSLFTTPVPVARWRGRMKRPGVRHAPRISLTRLGEAPRDRSGKRYPGTGYRPSADPAQGIDAHASLVMRRYKPHQGKWELRQSGGRTVAGGPPRLPRASRPVRLPRLPKAKSRSTSSIPGSTQMPRAFSPR